MRMAPVGLHPCLSEVFHTGVELAALTHGHPSGQLPAGVFAEIISRLNADDPLREALNKALNTLKTFSNHQETLAALELAMALDHDTNIPSSQAIERIGQGWVAEEALAISVYCALASEDYREGILTAVNHDGDSDSTGSVTGSILGLVYGLDRIPPGWIENLELREVICEIAEDLCNSPRWEIGDYPDDIDYAWVRKKYPYD